MILNELKIFVINLPSAIDRREHITTELNKLKLPFEVFNAVNGNTDLSYANKHYSPLGRLLRYARPLSNSQIGCFASHYELWNKCITLNEPILVLEDDIDFSLNFVTQLKLLLPCLDDYHYIRLAGTFQRPKCYVRNNVSLYSKKGPGGTIAYLLDPEAAQRLLNRASKWIEPVDEYMDRYWLHGVLPYVAEPEIIFFESKFESSVVNKYPAKIIFKITREIYKLYRGFCKLLFDCKK